MLVLGLRLCENEEVAVCGRVLCHLLCHGYVVIIKRPAARPAFLLNHSIQEGPEACSLSDPTIR